MGNKHDLGQIQDGHFKRGSDFGLIVFGLEIGRRNGNSAVYGQESKLLKLDIFYNLPVLAHCVNI